MPKYEVMTNDLGIEAIQRTDNDGSIYWIPCVEGNRDYQAYLASVAGN